MIAWAQPSRPAPAVAEPRGTPTTQAESPVVFFYSYGSFNPGAARGGLTCAVWADGVVLYAPNWTKPGESLELGKLAGPVSELLNQLRRDGLTNLEPTAVTVPDGRRLLMGVRGKGATAETKKADDATEVDDRLLVNTWDECILPGYGKNNKPDEAYRALAAGWLKTKITLASLVITQRHPLSKEDAPSGSFRGYAIDDSTRTPWLSGDTPLKKKSGTK